MPARKRLIQGVGTNTFKGDLYIKGKPIPAYCTWYGLLSRCYGAPKAGYENTSVCEEWLEFTNFREWYELHHVEGYHLDKDIIGDSTQYSPAHCCYVSPKVNCFLSFTKGGRGGLPTGVYRNSAGRFIAQSRDILGGRSRHIGTYSTAYSASEAWVNRRLLQLEGFLKAGLVTFAQHSEIKQLIQEEQHFA